MKKRAFICTLVEDEQEREKVENYFFMFSSQAWGELGGQEPWTSGDKVGDGRNIGRIEAAGVPNGKISWGRRGSPGPGWRCLHPARAPGSWRRRSSGCGVGGGEKRVYYQT